MTRDPRVDAYIQRAQPFARPILEHVRERVHALVPKAEETLKWSAPAFTLDGKILLVLGAFKAHVALNFWRGQELLGPAAEPGAMGQCGRIESIGDLPDELDSLIARAAELAREAPSPRKAAPKPKGEPQLHPEFEAALDRAPSAKAALDGFSASARRDYLEWICEAKRDDTRARRIATAVEWLSEGKKKNWKYERC